MKKGLVKVDEIGTEIFCWEPARNAGNNWFTKCRERVVPLRIATTDPRTCGEAPLTEK